MREESVMTNISAMRALAEHSKIEATRNENTDEPQAPKKSGGFSLFGFGFKNEVNPNEILPEERGFNNKA